MGEMPFIQAQTLFEMAVSGKRVKPDNVLFWYKNEFKF
tara:strand:- start:862 stop:975 length:114 start_codon:yes stop_codon:yes gene_type:complete